LPEFVVRWRALRAASTTDGVRTAVSCARKQTAKLKTAIAVDKQIAEVDEANLRGKKDIKDVALR